MTGVIVASVAVLASGSEAAGFVVLAIAGILLMVFMFLLRSLDLQYGIRPEPTGNPDQHVGIGCVAIVIMAIAILFLYLQK